ncbi:hypothetical protein ACFOUP_04950 [Belliella kenyensis]|uniref:Uncharacterized protein n=1 Tax=Belliella kenyensis TaxID=1472724 RepID=A0ABV8EIS8_9BACT|nr:hypothetical protein [Belliella kenyensis]MCH7402641.1 hypothetical protein [Belliella kenyensis]MDN3603811.1 hypothetical protein [Belliella kenyensis]
MSKIYIYPKQDNSNSVVPNPYMQDLERSLEGYFDIVNKSSCKNGVIEFFQYLFKTDAYILNWMEDLVYKRFGKIQILFFVFFILLKTIFRKKVIWILHNKYDRKNSKGFWVDFMYGLMMKHADLIITHAEDGVQFVREYFPQCQDKVHYLIHPINEPFVYFGEASKSYDLLIWGSIQPYKGILEFLRFVNKSSSLNKLKILIIGKCPNPNYLKAIEHELTSSMTLINEVIPLGQISGHAQKCKFVFFPYKSDTLLSSGVLMDSLRMHSKIIGPNSGAFRDLSSLSNVLLYNDFENLAQLISADHDLAYDKEEVMQFCYNHSWSAFGKSFLKLYSDNLK